MIIMLLINTILFLLYRLFDLLPNYTLIPQAARDAMATLTTYFGKANAIFPMDTLFQIGGIILGIEAGIWSFKLINWIYDKIRGAG